MDTPVVGVIGPRQCGKTTLVRELIGGERACFLPVGFLAPSVQGSPRPRTRIFRNFVSRYASRPSRPSSRPKPLNFQPSGSASMQDDVFFPVFGRIP